MSADAVPELPATASREEMEAYIVRSQPFVMRQACARWPAPGMWADGDELLAKVGADTLVTVRENVQEQGEWLGRPKDMPFGEFVRAWSQAEIADYAIEHGSSRLPALYLASLPVARNFPRLCDAIVIPPFAAEQGPKHGNLWMGNAGQVTPLHYDYSSGEPGMDGFHYLLAGRKVFRLYDPVRNLRCVPRKAEWWRWHQCAVDVDAPPDAAAGGAGEAFARAVPIFVTLEAGDMLFIPKLWWHHVYTLQRAVAVNFWFQHLGSEALKLSIHWPIIEEYLEAACAMALPDKRLHGVLQYHGLRGLSAAAVSFIRAHPIVLVALPHFVDHFGNVADSPFFPDGEKQRLGAELRARVRAWVQARMPARDEAGCLDEILAYPAYASLRASGE